MGKHTGKEKGPYGDRWRDLNLRQIRAIEYKPTSYDQDTAAFMSMSRELKEEGNRLFQRRDYEGALLKYEKAIKLLPGNHIDISYLRSNMAECYMQLGISEYPRAIHECNLALEVTPKYSKALLKRARCYEALNRLDLALRDVSMVLKMEQNNLMASEIEQRLKQTFERQGSRFNEVPIDLVPLPEYIEPVASQQSKGPKENATKSKSNNLEEYNEEKGHYENEMKGKFDDRKADAGVGTRMSDEDLIAEKNTEDKLVVEEEKISNVTEEEPKRTVKLVFGEDIRWAQIPVNCSILKLREIVADRFPSSKAVLVKYKDQEGDLVTITTTEELRWAEASAGRTSVKLYIVEVNPDQDPFFQKLKKDKLDLKQLTENVHVGKRKEVRSESTCISDWIIQFAQIFKNYVGFDIDAYIDLHEVGMKVYSEAMEETVTSEEAQDLFGIAADKFQEMSALALFNCGNVHMSRARKRVYFTEDSPRESFLENIKSAYDWAQKEFTKAGERYEEALRIKPDFYEAVLALGQQQFEQAKLSWYYAVGTEVDLDLWPSGEVLMLYNNAEENMERGMQMWEEQEEHRQNELFKPNKIETLLQKMKLDNLFKRISADEAEEQATNIRSQIYVLWGTMLYERSIMEFKVGLPVWQECLEVAVEKFELAGASPTDIAVMIKNHCSNDTALEGLGFNIDEIVQAWNEMYEAKKWQSTISSFRLEPLLRRRISKLCYALECA
ncbi:Myosin assembly protein/sexual cycle protein [Handroanthus impetiginosus]|uniref:Myosin assembly protein/sexual cycle protein n=1 Tax=Handroanthus impetiginosus TaxID=429701 RepID=A0A2G9HXI2_9LAMI|nr:Myosin assembly protein/sexual cycle protein [Handroanthus impetiginosus]